VPQFIGFHGEILVNVQQLLLSIIPIGATLTLDID